MPTRPLGPGTRNLSINAPVAMAQAVGRLAVIEGYRSVGELVREVLAERLAQARARGLDLARDTRQLVLPLAMCWVIACGMAATVAGAILGESEPRRPGIVRTASTVKSVKASGRRREEDLGA